MPNQATPRPLAEFTTDAVRLTEGKNGLPKLEGTVAKANVVNRNNRFYSREVFEKAVTEVQALVEGGEFTGELDHPDFSALGSLERTAFVFDHLSLVGDDVTFEARLLNTPAGNTLKGLLEGGVRVGMSTRGTASVEWDEREGEDSPPIAIIQDDFRLFGVDAVKVPSNEAGFVRLRESVEARISHQSQQEGEEITVKITTVKQLREEYADLVNEVEEAATAEANAALEEATSQVEALTSDLATAQETITALETKVEEAEAAQAQLETLRRALLGDDASEDAEDVEEGANDLSVAVSALQETVDALKSELDTARSEKDRLESEHARVAAFEAAIEKSAFGKILREEIDPKAFDSEDAMLAEVTRLEKLAKRVSGSAGTPGKGKTNVGEGDEADDTNENPYVSERAKKLAGIGEG